MHVITDYQMSFKGLVPLSKYKGTPKLSARAIEQINNIKVYIGKIDKKILDTENDISISSSIGNRVEVLKAKLKLLNDCKLHYECLIQRIRQKGCYKGYLNFSKSDKNIQEQLNLYAEAIGDHITY